MTDFKIPNPLIIKEKYLTKYFEHFNCLFKKKKDFAFSFFICRLFVLSAIPIAGQTSKDPLASTVVMNPCEWASIGHLFYQLLQFTLGLAFHHSYEVTGENVDLW